MHNAQPRPIKTGHDPRALPDFIALREEMAKLTHPARPDVNWKQVEALSLSLFEINGVELQTGAWYTLARSHLARVNGINEGLAILNALLSHQWSQLWPQPVHARAEILNGLFQRLQKIFRTYSLSAADLPALQQAERQMDAMNDILARQALKHACQTTPLMQQVRSALTRLENSSAQEGLSPAVTLPAQAFASMPANDASSPVNRLVYVIRPEPEANVDVIHETQPQPKRWPIFLAGACSSLVAGAIALWGWNLAHRADELSVALQASVSSLPKVLTQEQVQALRQSEHLNADPTRWSKRLSSQLDAVAELPPDWTIRYGNALLTQGIRLWPENPEMTKMQKNWQQRLAGNALTANSLTGWNEGMQQLQRLTDRLNALDGQKGKYITVSELKSSVYEMMTSFRQTVPLEEQLRQAASSATQGADAIALQQRIEDHLKRSIVSYSQLNGSQPQPEAP